MHRVRLPAVIGLVLVLAASLAFGDELAPGQYQIAVFNGPTKVTYCLIKVEREGAKLQGEVTASGPALPGAELRSIRESTGEVRLVLSVRGQSVQFVGRAADEEGSRGVVVLPTRTVPARLEPSDKTQLTARDATERLPENRDFVLASGERDPKQKVRAFLELIEKNPDSPAVFGAYNAVLFGAKPAELSAAEVEQVANQFVAKAKEWHALLGGDTLTQIAATLNRADYLPEVAVKFARRARESVAKDASEAALRAADLTLAQSLVKAGQAAEAEQLLVSLYRRRPDDQEIAFTLGLAKETAGDLDAAIELWASLFTYRPAAEPLRQAWQKKHGSMTGFEEMLDAVYSKHVPPFQPEKFTGRQSQAANGVVLMELFTGAVCPPCVAADVAYDTLHKTYGPKEVIFLQYHLHIPGPDPMTNADCEVRAKYYAARGTPSTYFNGKSEAYGGGGMQAARAKYDQYRQAIDPKLESSVAGNLKLRVFSDGETIKIEAAVVDLAGPDNKLPEQLKLRLAVVEETVRYAGPNGIRLHHAVVRFMPGGPDGIDIDEPNFDVTEVVPVDDVRKSLAAYLTEYEEKLKAGPRPYTFPARPLLLEHLKVVAFVQDDESKQVLLATEAAVQVQ